MLLAAPAMLTGAAHAQDPMTMARKGATAYRACAGCHSLQPGVHLTGPSLAGLWGKKAATIANFRRYTRALQNADLVWDENSLQAWIADPQQVVPGTSMTFRGIDQDETRLNLVAFLRQATAPNGAADVVKRGFISQRLADGQIPTDLSTPDPKETITSIRHCGDAYHIRTADGSEFPFWETNVRIKTDTGPRGPRTGAPVLLRSGMAGDRISVVFASLDEIGRLISEKCP
jgi:cytochrome c